MPDGAQWSWEDVHNAKRAAEYLVEAQRKEAARQAKAADREARRTKRTIDLFACLFPPCQNGIQEEIRWNTGACRSARDHAKDARAARFGSKEYIKARYGYVCGEFGNSNCYYGTILSSLMTAEGLSEDQAWDRIVSSYTEERWKKCEAPLTEYFLNNVSC